MVNMVNMVWQSNYGKCFFPIGQKHHVHHVHHVYAMPFYGENATRNSRRHRPEIYFLTTSNQHEIKIKKNRPEQPPRVRGRMKASTIAENLNRVKSDKTAGFD